MKAYSYIETNIMWIGKVPSHWKRKKIKFISNVIMGQSPKSEECNDLGNGYPFLQGNAEFGSLNPIEQHYCYNPNKICPKDSLLLSVRAPVGALNKADKEYGIGRGLCAIQPIEHINTNYLWYSFHLLKIELLMQSTGSTFDAVSIDEVKNIISMLPPYYEQKSIAEFLDHKTSQIDDLIEQKEELLELLEEKRIALITHAVTKGVNADVKMKPSNIPWFGEVPLHWKKDRIKFSTYVKGRVGWHGLNSNEFLYEGDYYLVTGTDFIKKEIIWETCYRITEERYAEDPYIQLQENDLLITKDGTIGKLAIVKNIPFKASVNSGVFVTRSLENQYSTEYMYYLLSSRTFKEFIDYNKSGTTISHLYQEVFENFEYFYPSSLDEQIKIIDYIDYETKKIDVLSNKVIEAIEKLKEYRTSLITSAVTGKIDVRNFKIPEKGKNRNEF